jgi:NAD(P)H-dependent FMN reductase
VRILGLNGSHRVHGATAMLLEHLQEGAGQAGGTFEVISLAARELHRCRGCFACQTVQPLHCVWDGTDDVAAVQQRMREADLLVFATPVYVFGVSSLLKAFLERLMSTADCGDLRASRSGRLFHAIDPALGSKPFAVLISCDNIEPETPRNALGYFRTYARFMDAPLVGAISRATARRAGRWIVPVPSPVRLVMKLHLARFQALVARHGRDAVPVAPERAAR